MQQFSILISWRLFTVQHVLGVLSPIIRSSTTAVAASGFYLRIVVIAVLCSWSGRPRTQHGYHHDTKVKPEAATAVVELMMMGGRTPETFWAVNKRQDNKMENCCIWLVIFFYCTMMHGLTKLKINNYKFIVLFMPIFVTAQNLSHTYCRIYCGLLVNNSLHRALCMNVVTWLRIQYVYHMYLKLLIICPCIRKNEIWT
jgi:hypothetical protein